MKLAALGRLATRSVDGAVALIERARQARLHPPRRARLERFGAILQLTVPRALVFVDRAFARRVLDTQNHATQDHATQDHTTQDHATQDHATGEAARKAGHEPQHRLGGPAIWTGRETQLGDAPLSAPLEAHLQLTNRCDAGCQGCYTGASPGGAPNEWGLAEWMRAIDHLAAAGVFHVALGGGESTVLPWLGELADHARRRGIIPNLTTSGLANLDQLLAIADRFGQINVSLDGLGATYAAVRGFDGFARADAAIRALRRTKREVGINVVVTRKNFAELDGLFAYAARHRLSEVELLRFKPSGRGARAYGELRCSDAQHRAFLPAVLAAARRHAVRVKVDCSYTPMLAHHRPDRALLAELAVYGCTGGDFLIGAKPGGQLTACSFAAPPPVPPGAERPRVTELRTYWDTPGAFGAFRSWRDAREPCASCEYHALCRGGCKVVSAHTTGDPSAPDPECPRVVDQGSDQASDRGSDQASDRGSDQGSDRGSDQASDPSSNQASDPSSDRNSNPRRARPRKLPVL